MGMTMGIADAKAHLSEVIARVENGEVIVIARNGDPVAEIRPLRRATAAETVTRIREIAHRVAKRNEGNVPWPEPGRRMRDVMHDGHRF